MPALKALKYAHGDGHTEVCFHEDGQHLLTCGSDGNVHVWNGAEDDEAVTHRIGDRVHALLYKNSRFFTSADTFTIQMYTYPEGAPDGICTHFTAPVHHMVANKSGKTVAAGSSDFTIRITDVDTCKSETCRGHEAPVLSVALDPQEEFLASSSCDGTVRVWRLEDKSQVTSLKILPKTNDFSFSKTLCRLCWDRDKGKVLFVPVEKEIQLYERSTWNVIGSIKDDNVNGVFSVLALSPEGNYLAAGSSEGTIAVFDVKTKICVDRYMHEKKFAITSLAWNPKQSTLLAFCDNEGYLGVLEDISLLKETKPSDPVRAKETIGIFDDEDDDFLIQATGDVAEEDKDKPLADEDDDLLSSKVKPLGDLDDDADSKQAGSDMEDNASTVSDFPLVLPKPVAQFEGYQPTPLQPPFQPGSTPVHLSSRFMLWNSIGLIKQYNTDEENSIDIEFHNTSIHHAMHVTNTSNYTMADLSTEAVVLANRADEDGPSKLLCMHFGSWDNCKEWTIPMPDGEDILAVTVGEDWVAVATDRRNIRTFSIGGIQKEIFCLPGPVMCLSAHTNQLMAVYHRGMGIPGDQCMGVMLMHVDGKQRCVLRGDPLPLSAKASLSWLGFSAQGTPYYMESTGIVRMFNRKFSQTWVQVANTKSHVKGKSDHYFIVGVNENPQQLRCIPCKGAKYPPTLPRPAVAILPFQIPLCDLVAEKGQYEESLLRTRLFGQHFDHWSAQGYDFEESMKTEYLKPATEALVKLFALSARSDRDFSAMEVCEMMTEQHTLQLAIRYASRMKRLQLAEKISELAQLRAEEEAAKSEMEEQDDEDQMVRTSNWHNRNGYRGQNEEEEEEVMDEGDEVVEEEQDDRPSGPLLNLNTKSEKLVRPQSLFSGKSNPFKVTTPQKASVGGVKGTQVFDNMSRKKTTKAASPPVAIGKPAKENIKYVGKKSGSQGRLFAAKGKTKAVKSDDIDTTPAVVQQSTPSAFDLWFEENKDSIVEEHPDLSEEDLIKEGTEQFQGLPKEEKQTWLQKARQLKNENSENTEINSADNKKRKRDEDMDSKETKEITSKKKKESFLDMKKKPLSQNTNSKLSGFAFQKD